MKRLLIASLVALVVLCLLNVIPAHAQHFEDEEDNEEGNGVHFATGTFEGLASVVKDIVAKGEAKKAQEAAARKASEKSVESDAAKEAKNTNIKKEAAKTTTEAESPKTGAKPASSSAKTSKKSEATKSAAKETAKPSSATATETSSSDPKTVAQSKVKRTGKRANQLKFYPVKRIIQMEGKEDLYPIIRKEAVPVLISNTPIAREWPAFNTWTFEWFAERWGTSHAMGPILVTNGSVDSGMHEALLMWNYASEETQWPGVPKPYKGAAMNLGTFFSGQCQKQTPDTWWWMQALHTMKDPLIAEQTSPMDFFMDTSLKKNKTKPLSSLVTSSMGGQLHLHYDTDDMWIVQAYQKTQVLLFSPEDMLKMYLYPYTHPHRRRSQVLPLTSATEDQFPGIADIEGKEALLDAKDVLYIPKYWGYHIINTSPGIFLQVMTKNIEEASEPQWDFRRHLVGLGHLPLYKRINAAVWALKRIVQPLLHFNKSPNPFPGEILDPPDYTKLEFPRADLRAFLREHVKQRYKKLPDYRDQSERQRKDKKALLKDVKRDCRTARDSLSKDDKLQPLEKLKFTVTLDAAVYAFYAHSEMSPRLLMMHDWVDWIAWQAFGDHTLAEAFLLGCF